MVPAVPPPLERGHIRPAAAGGEAGGATSGPARDPTCFLLPRLVRRRRQKLEPSPQSSAGLRTDRGAHGPEEETQIGTPNAKIPPKGRNLPVRVTCSGLSDSRTRLPRPAGQKARRPRWSPSEGETPPSAARPRRSVRVCALACAKHVRSAWASGRGRQPRRPRPAAPAGSAPFASSPPLPRPPKGSPAPGCAAQVCGLRRPRSAPQ